MHRAFFISKGNTGLQHKKKICHFWRYPYSLSGNELDKNIMKLQLVRLA